MKDKKYPCDYCQGLKLDNPCDQHCSAECYLSDNFDDVGLNADWGVSAWKIAEFKPAADSGLLWIQLLIVEVETDPRTFEACLWSINYDQESDHRLYFGHSEDCPHGLQRLENQVRAMACQLGVCDC